MVSIVVVHGVGQQLEGEHSLHSRLFPAMSDGLARVGMHVAPSEVAFAYYGHLFRPEAEVLGSEPYLDAFDVDNPFDQELLAEWWKRAVAVDDAVIPEGEETLVRSPLWAQRALFALNQSQFFSGVVERALIGDFRQVRSYMTSPTVRAKARGEVARHITTDTRVVVGHSLGSVVAYETLCAHLDWSVSALVTLGSPLGVRHLIYDRLQPPPKRNGSVLRGAWPGPVTTWTNIADAGDVVAAVEDLRPLFGERVRQIRVHNGSHAHDMRPYLTDRATGAAIAAGLHG